MTNLLACDSLPRLGRVVMPDKLDEMRPLPPLDANLILLACKLELERNERGAGWCLQFGIGGLRRKKLGMVPGDGAGGRASELLHQLCKSCTLKCVLAGE